MGITVKTCPIEGLLVVEPAVHADERGYFMEAYNARDFRAAGIDRDFVQMNQSLSRRGVLRGLHYQKEHPQAKLARVIHGRVFDVAVDLRSGSSTFGQWWGVELSEENHREFLIPEGFAHGLLVLSETALFEYQCTDYWHPGDEGGIAWNDPAIGVRWPELTGTYSGTASAEGYALSDGTPLSLSGKDQRWGGLREAFRFS